MQAAGRNRERYATEGSKQTAFFPPLPHQHEADQRAECDYRQTSDYERDRVGLRWSLQVFRDGRRSGQRAQNPALDMYRRLPVPKLLRLLVDPRPQLGGFLFVVRREALARNFAVEPGLNSRRCRRSFPVHRFVRGSSLRLFIRHAYFSSSRAWSASRARWTRIFSAPTVVSSSTAISSYDRPSTCFITNASRSDSGRRASAYSRSVRSSLRSISSSGVENDEGWSSSS